MGYIRAHHVEDLIVLTTNDAAPSVVFVGHLYNDVPPRLCSDCVCSF